MNYVRSLIISPNRMFFLLKKEFYKLRKDSSICDIVNTFEVRGGTVTC